MTGIAGSVGSLSETEQLIEGIRYRGPDGLAQWQDESAFLVHAHLACVPQPTHTFKDHPTRFICTGDIRLDNREEIAALCEREITTTDAELVVAAYEALGPACCAHFIGDFAFAIWDSATSQLFCARDPFGVRPFYYRSDSTDFAFASDEAALGARVSDPGDERFVADFLAGIVAYETQTRHPGINRLLGGHWLLWSQGDLQITRYWELTAKADPSGDPAGRFRALFERAVSDRLYGTSDPAAFLSGGLDSSSIATVAGRLRQDAALPALKTFSFVYPQGSKMDESPYIDAVLTADGFAPHKELVEDHAPLKGVDDMIRDQRGPIIAAGMAKSRKLYHVAAEAGTNVILDGHGGDEVVGYGTYRLIQMAQNGQWLRLLPVLHTHCNLIGDNRLISALDLFKVHGPKHKPARLLRKIGNRLARRQQSQNSMKDPAWRRILSDDFRTRVDLVQRYNHLAVMSHDARADETDFNIWPILSPMMQSGFEVLDKASAAAGVEARYPFFDVRLVAFCVGLPSSEKLRFGQTRSILRRALKGILPDKVRLRQSKTSFHPEIVAGLITHHQDLLDEMKRDPHTILTPYVNEAPLHELIDQLKHQNSEFDGGDAMFLWRLSSFYLWRKSALGTEGELT